MHMKHGYYLIWIHYAYSGTNEESKEQGQEEEEDGRENGEEEELQEISQPPDDRPGPDVRSLKRQPSSSQRTSGPDRTTGAPAPEPNERTTNASGRPATGRLAPSGNPLHQHPSQNERTTGAY